MVDNFKNIFLDALPKFYNINENIRKCNTIIAPRATITGWITNIFEMMCMSESEDTNK